MPHTKLPLLSMLSSKPLWIDDGVSGRNDSVHRSDYKFMASRDGKKIKAPSSRPKVWALISRLPIDHTYESPLLPAQPVIDDWGQNIRYWKRPDEIIIPNEPFERHSNYCREYTEKVGDRFQVERPRHEAISSAEPFTSVSAYKNDFPWHNLSKPSNREGHLLPLRSSTANDSFSFSGKPVCKGENQHFTEIQSRWTPPSQPFARETSYSNDFGMNSRPFHVTPPRPIKPMEKFVHTPFPFESTSDYRENFIKMPFPPKERRVLQNLDSMGYQGGRSNLEYLPPSDAMTRGTAHMSYVEHNKSVFYGANNPQE
jgi:hypothetical protein